MCASTHVRLLTQSGQKANGRGNAFEVSLEKSGKSKVDAENEPGLNKPMNTTVDDPKRNQEKRSRFTFGPFRHLARRPAGSRCIFRPSNPRLFRFPIQPGAWGKKDRARCKIDASLILFARRATRSNENKNPVAKEKDGRETDEKYP